MSYSKVFADRECHNFRAFFAARWAEFLKENYRNPEEVAVVFGVRYQTALNWFQGQNAPSGYAVAMAFQNDPAGAAKHLAMDAHG
jgi:hypothetical protein